MRLFASRRRDVSQATSTTFSCASSSASSKVSSSSLPSSTRSPSSSLTWSLCTLIILNSFLTFLSPSTGGGLAHAALDPGFCGDCQTFSNAIGVCGGSFGAADIEINGEYVLQQQYSKCICTEVMQKVLWTCAKCELLAGHQSKAPPPQKYQTQCIAWGMTVQEWKTPYTGVVAPGTQTDVTGAGGSSTPVPPATTTTAPTAGKPSTGGPSTTVGSGGQNPPSTTDPNAPSSSSDNSVSGPDSTTETNSGPNGTAIGISVGIIGVAVVAGVVAVVMMKRRRRRRTPLDLDSLPAEASFVALEDKWEKPHHHSGSPPLPPAPIASAAPVVGRGGRGGYQMEGSVVGGYDPQYDGGYGQYGHGGHGGYDGYGGSVHGQYMNQYDDQYVGYHPSHQQEAYQMHDYGYEHNNQGPNAQYHPGGLAKGDKGAYL
ncbi:hypothetical protein BGZ54_003098 [Gamsiella multidivaricata]|nr:hypothetical protein BGZ54_003098 [Gamsiella multidivaricata]